MYPQKFPGKAYGPMAPIMLQVLWGQKYICIHIYKFVYIQMYTPRTYFTGYLEPQGSAIGSLTHPEAQINPNT